MLVWKIFLKIKLQRETHIRCWIHDFFTDATCYSFFIFPGFPKFSHTFFHRFFTSKSMLQIQYNNCIHYRGPVKSLSFKTILIRLKYLLSYRCNIIRGLERRGLQAICRSFGGTGAAGERNFSPARDPAKSKRSGNAL